MGAAPSPSTDNAVVHLIVPAEHQQGKIIQCPMTPEALGVGRTKNEWWSTILVELPHMDDSRYNNPSTHNVPNTRASPETKGAQYENKLIQHIFYSFNLQKKRSFIRITE